MRDPKRIDRIIKQLRIAWGKSPDLRLGQLLVNVAGQNLANNLFYYEDDEWLKAFESFESRYLGNKGGKTLKGKPNTGTLCLGANRGEPKGNDNKSF